MKKLIAMSSIFMGCVLISGITAQAEIIDNSATPVAEVDSIKRIEPKTNFPQYADARWKLKPTVDSRSLFRLSSYLPTCDCDAQGQPLANCQPQKITMVADMLINKQGDVETVNVLESSGVHYFDRIVRLSILKQAKLHPFTKNGLPVSGRVKVPLTHPYNPRMQHGCYELRQSLQNEQSAK